MIVRQPLQCEICAQPHIARIGLGRSDRQEHIFPCRQCGLEIGVRLWLKQDLGQYGIDEWVQCEPLKDVPPDAPIVNLDPDFLIPKEMQGVDMTFARLHQMQEMATSYEDSGTVLNLNREIRMQGAAGGDARGEWADLRRAWLLTRKGQRPLVKGCIQNANKVYYGYAPIENVGDWIFRFNQSVGGIPLKNALADAANTLKPIESSSKYSRLLAHYEAEMASHRGRLYLDVYNSFFAAYDDFQQLAPRLAAGLDITPNLEVSSGQFERTRMFYGNAFEALGSLVDLLAFTNNVLLGREWDTFERLTVPEYLRLDKSSRFNPYSGTPGLANLSTEADNQLRNASHHGGLVLDIDTQIITYRAGKGGQGDIQTLPYTQYLHRCIILFRQILTLFCLELVMTQRLNNQPF